MQLSSWLATITRTIKKHRGLSQRRKRRLVVPAIEAMEQRVLLTAPVAYDTSDGVHANSMLTSSVSYSDPEMDPVTASIVDSVANGTLSFNSDGTYTYTPSLNFVGSDSFTFKVNDGTQESNTATVSITISNSEPTADNGSDGVHANSMLTSSVSFSDPDLDPLTVSVIATTVNGTLNLNSDGTYTYTPNTNFTGNDSFTFKANDGIADSDPATVTISVTNSAPTASDGSDSIEQNTALYSTVAASDSDLDSIAIIQVSDPGNGTLTLNSDGSFFYTPNVGFVGTDSFQFKASDGIADSATATHTITVNSDGMTGWAVSGPSGTVFLDQTDGVVTVYGVRGNNPNAKTVTLDVWNLFDPDIESPTYVFTIDGGDPGSTWSVSFMGTPGNYFVELNWDTVTHTGINDPLTLFFDVQEYSGDPTP